MKDLKIVSLSELKRARMASEVIAQTKLGVNEVKLPDNPNKKQIELRSVWDHFYDLDKLEQDAFDSLNEMR